MTITVASGETLDLSGVTNSLSGTLTINDSAGDNTIVGTSANDTLTLLSGNDTINLGAGDDTINVTNMSDLTSADTITNTSGIDTLNINGSGTIACCGFERVVYKEQYRILDGIQNLIDNGHSVTYLGEYFESQT
jgi:Ca2+-binding RTX toxin-like protein